MKTEQVRNQRSISVILNLVSQYLGKALRGLMVLRPANDDDVVKMKVSVNSIPFESTALIFV